MSWFQVALAYDGSCDRRIRWQSLLSQLKSAERPWHKSARPLHLCGWIPNKTDDEPHVWYEPTLSKVMQVAAYEIVYALITP